MCKKFQDDLYKVSGSIAHIVHFDYNGRSSYRQKHYDFITTVIFVVYLKSSIFISYINITYICFMGWVFVINVGICISKSKHIKGQVGTPDTYTST